MVKEIKPVGIMSVFLLEAEIRERSSIIKSEKPPPAKIDKGIKVKSAGKDDRIDTVRSG